SKSSSPLRQHSFKSDERQQPVEWNFIKSVLPNTSRGVKRVDDRRVIVGVFLVLRTGIPCAGLSA
ncbi:MAG: hypothetical protein Q4P24_00005, partial [Rhodobacterales bacterium]|nr:hypothetical protein [Rhodobacterales bacterium]